MAEQNKYEHDLPEKVGSMTDFIRTVGEDNVSYKSAIEEVSKTIIEEYDGSSLGGTERTLKSAIGSLFNADTDLYERVMSDAEFTSIEARLGIGG